jgi:hypothetical protein
MVSSTVRRLAWVCSLSLGCMPQAPVPVPPPACTVPRSDGQDWRTVAFAKLPITLRVPVGAQLADSEMTFAPAEARWWIPHPAHGFVSVATGPRLSPQGLRSFWLEAPAWWAAPAIPEAHCVLQLGGRQTQFASGYMKAHPSYFYAVAYWPISADSGIHLMAESPTQEGIRVGIAVLHSVWPSYPHP